MYTKNRARSASVMMRMCFLPWRKCECEKFWQSELFRYLYPSQCESFRTNPNNVLYLVLWKTVKNQSDLIQLIPRHQSEWIRTNPKPSFQSRSIRINPSSDWSEPNFQSESMIDLDLKLGFALVRIHSDWCLGINRIKSDWFFTVFHQTRHKTLFGLVRNYSHWLGYRYRNESE